MEFDQLDSLPESEREAAKQFLQTYYYKEGERSSKAIARKRLEQFSRNVQERQEQQSHP